MAIGPVTRIEPATEYEGVLENIINALEFVIDEMAEKIDDLKRELGHINKQEGR